MLKMNLIKPFLVVGTHKMPSKILDTCTEGFMWCFADWAFDVTGGLFWTMMLLGFCVAVYVAISRLGSTRAFGYASFVGMTGSIFLAILQLMPWWTASAFILVGGIGIAMMVISERF